MKFACKLGLCLAFLSLFGACSSLTKEAAQSEHYVLEAPNTGAGYRDFVFIKTQLQIYSGKELEAKKNLEDYLSFQSEAGGLAEQASFEIMLARLLIGMGDFSGAGQIYFNLLSRHYEDNAVLAEVARFFYTIQNYEQALSLYKHLIKTEPKVENHLVYAGLISLELKKFAQSKKYFNMIINNFSDSRHLGHYYLGELYESQSKVKSSLWHYGKCNKHAPLNFSACVLSQSKLLSLLGQEDKSTKLLTNFLEKYKDEQVLKKVINAYFLNADYKTALSYMFELEKLKPYDLDVKRKLGHLLMTNSEPSEALTRFKLVSLSRESQDQDYINVLETLKVLGKTDEMNKYSRTIASSKDLGESFFIKQHSLLAAPFSEHSRFCVNVKKENKASCYYVSGLDSLNNKNYTSAQRSFRKVLKYDKKSHKAFYMIGRINFESDKSVKNGEEKILKSLELKPDYSDALNYLAYTWAAKGEKLEQSLSFSQKALSQEPTNGYFLDTFGYVLYQMKEYENALTVFKKAAALIPNNAEIYEHIADVYVALNKPKEALGFYQLASALLKGENLQKLGGKIARFKEQNSRRLGSISNSSANSADSVRVPANVEAK